MGEAKRGRAAEGCRGRVDSCLGRRRGAAEKCGGGGGQYQKVSGRNREAAFRRTGSGERMRRARTGLAHGIRRNEAEYSSSQKCRSGRARTVHIGNKRQKCFGGVRFKAQN